MFPVNNQRQAMLDGASGDESVTAGASDWNPATVGEALAPVRMFVDPIGSLVNRIPLPTYEPSMLNANREGMSTADDTTPAGGVAPSPTHSASTTTAKDWHKYIPWLLVLLVVVVLLYSMSKHRGKGAAS